MSRRTIQKHILMTQEEALDLQKKAQRACMSEAALIRLLVKGYEPRERPDERFYEAMEQMRTIGRGMDQLAAQVRANGCVDSDLLTEEARHWHSFQAEIERVYLRPVRRSDDPWP